MVNSGDAVHLGKKLLPQSMLQPFVECLFAVAVYDALDLGCESC